jgi:hypothetical protein
MPRFVIRQVTLVIASVTMPDDDNQACGAKQRNPTLGAPLSVV